MSSRTLPWPRGHSLTDLEVLGLGLESLCSGLGLGLGLESRVLGLGLGLESQVLGLGLGLDYQALSLSRPRPRPSSILCP